MANIYEFKEGFYVCKRLRKRCGKRTHFELKHFKRNIWFLKSGHLIPIKFITYPKEWIGRKIRLKIEFVNENDEFANNKDVIEIRNTYRQVKKK